MKQDIIKKKNWNGFTYQYVVKGKNRGEVRIPARNKTRIIPKFPHIKRIFSLEAGFKHLGLDKVWVEEKVDGYNLRVIQHNGELFAFTRGGVLCPFSTEKIRQIDGLYSFFEEYPNAIVNGEMAGPHNPYITQYPPYVNEDVRFFVFDMMVNSRFVEVERRIELVNQFGLDSVRSFGLLDLDGVKDVVKEHYADMEGIVLKSPNRKLAVKYVFPDSDIDDIRVAIKIFPEVRAGYYLQRLVRTSIFLKENGIDPNKYYGMVGQSFLNGLFEIVDNVKSGGEVYEDFTIIVNNPKTAYDLVELLAEHVKVDVVDIKNYKGRYMITIRKFYPDATRYWRERLHGKMFVD